MIEVIVLTYNHQDFISRCLEGILSQKLDERLVCTVIDDCSTDRTFEILKEISKDVEIDLSIIKSSQNFRWSTMHPAFRAIKSSTAEFLAFCDGDDYWTDAEKLHKQIKIAKANPSAGLIHTDYKTLEFGRPETEAKSNTNQIRQKSSQVKTAFDLIAGNHIKHSTVLIRRSCLNMDFLAGSDFVLPKDWLMYVDVLSKSHALYIDEATTVHRVHKSGLWNGANVAQQQTMKEQVRWFCASQLIDENLRKAFRKKVAIDYLRSIVAESRIYGSARPLVIFSRRGAYFLKSIIIFLRRN
jgi:glycosyltransferase involved in cell wall biosynthesis